MTDLFLIAHVVRGEPAFDIATQMCDPNEDNPCQPNCGRHPDCKDEEVWWIIPTSGHRAYPYWNSPLDEAMDWEALRLSGNPVVELPPEGHPDHYQVSASKAKPTGPSLADRLGLNVRQPSAPIRRRV